MWKICKALTDGLSSNIKYFKTQLSKMVQSGLLSSLQPFEMINSRAN